MPAARSPQPAARSPQPAARSPQLLSKQARRESNPQPPVLETGALPIELRTCFRLRCDATRALLPSPPQPLNN